MLKTVLLSTVLSFAAFGAQSAEVTSGQFDDWRYEIVSSTAPGGAQRTACSVATGPEATPVLLLAFARADADVPGDLSGFVFVEYGEPFADMPIGVATEIDFIAGDVRSRGRVSIAGAPDGERVQSEAFPASEATPGLIAAMQTSPSISLVLGSEVLRTIPLAGFAEAYAAAQTSCQYAVAAKG